MANVGIGRREGCEEGDADHHAAHFAVTHVVARHAATGLTTQIGVVKQCPRVTGEQCEREPMLCYPIHGGSLFLQLGSCSIANSP